MSLLPRAGSQPDITLTLWGIPISAVPHSLPSCARAAAVHRWTRAVRLARAPGRVLSAVVPRICLRAAGSDPRRCEEGSGGQARRTTDPLAVGGHGPRLLRPAARARDRDRGGRALAGRSRRVDALGLLLTICAAVGVALLAQRVQAEREEKAALVRDLELARAEGESWRAKVQSSLNGIRTEIANQFRSGHDRGRAGDRAAHLEGPEPQGNRGPARDRRCDRAAAGPGDVSQGRSARQDRILGLFSSRICSRRTSARTIRSPPEPAAPGPCEPARNGPATVRGGGGERGEGFSDPVRDR
jgi:hypothetical protein